MNEKTMAIIYSMLVENGAEINSDFHAKLIELYNAGLEAGYNVAVNRMKKSIDNVFDEMS